MHGEMIVWVVSETDFLHDLHVLACNAFSIQDNYVWRNDCFVGQWDRFSA